MRAVMTALLLVICGQFQAEEVAVFSAGLRLAGTYEDGDQAAALILAGSGPTDRNGNSSNGLSSDTYALLAQAMAERGVATLRTDKRGIGGSTGDGNAVLLSDYAADTALWIDTLKQRTGQACVWLIGHSEGGLIALATAQGRTDLCGLILIATPGRGLDDILLDQLGTAPAMAPYMEATRGFLDQLKAGQEVAIDEMPTILVPMFPPAVHGYLRDLLAFDPIAVAKTTPQQSLMVQGAQDLQTSMADAEALVAALPNATLALFAQMTHMLKDADGTQAGNMATYTDPAIPLTAGLVDRILTFMSQP
jgi:pimeloyl-ACP methyl ester carboxylesterase